jgi:hypothetical protein
MADQSRAWNKAAGVLMSGVAAAGLLIGTTGTANAETRQTRPAAGNGASGQSTAGADGRSVRENRDVIAHYKGERISLADGWHGAKVCTEVPTGEIYCHDSLGAAERALSTVAAHAEHVKRASAKPGNRAAATAAPGPAGQDVSTMDLSDCPSGYACLFQYPGYDGRVLRWSASGSKDLGDWGFSDAASAASINRVRGAHAVDHRTGLPDPELWLGAGSAYRDFRKYDYTYGGNWNNKADEFVLS